jgi:hypothetical protein
MATTTPNYGWPVPTSTDYVKDGATAIEALGDAIDTTVFDINSGLTFISKTTIGSAVASVTVSNAFSTNYDNYYITVTGGVGSATGYLSLTLGATATGYYRVNVIAPYTTGTLSTFQSTNASSWFAVFPFTTNSISGFADLQNPFTAKNTHFFSRGSQSDTAGEIGINSGYLANTTSYTGFTLTTSTGTITGGTIKVYGYK